MKPLETTEQVDLLSSNGKRKSQSRGSVRHVTMSQALVGFLKKQFVERDGIEHQFFAGMWGIFGHGCVAGVGQALLQNPDFPYYLCRNEQGAVHIATAFAKANFRLRTFACISSIGPGATNMVTGAATATINRLPVLLLPGDIFASRTVGPVLQQLECENSEDVSVNDAFRPVSRYWDRLYRPDQLISSAMQAMRVLTSPSQTGAVVLSLPQDVQAQAWDYPEDFFEKRIWTIPRPMADRDALRRAAEEIRNARCPLLIAGGGVLYSHAWEALGRFAERTGIAVVETQAGKGSLSCDHRCNLGAMGVTGTRSANLVAREADLVIGVGTRLSDFTTASRTAFQNPNVAFLNINITEIDAHKNSGLPLVADARVALEELTEALAGYTTNHAYSVRIAEHKAAWESETDRLYSLRKGDRTPQSAVIGVVNEAAGEHGVVVGAAGSLPGDLHKLWRTRLPGGYHMEYGYSCMGYEIAGGLGVKIADPSRDVYVMVGDGSFLMMSSEITTSIQEGYKLNIILVDNYGFASIGGLSRTVGSQGFGTEYRYRSPETGQLDGDRIRLDLVAAASGLGAHALRVNSAEELRQALRATRAIPKTVVFVIETEKEVGVPSYETSWNVPVPEVSEIETVREARRRYESDLTKARLFTGTSPRD